MLSVELVECVASASGEIGRALIGDGLGTGGSAERFADHLDDMLGALVVVDDDGVEQRVVTTADVLGCDELESDPEGFDVGGVCSEPCARQGAIEADATAAWRGLAGLGRWVRC